MVDLLITDGVLNDRDPDIAVGLYAEGDAMGLASYAITSTTDQTITDKDRYALFIGQYTAGTHDPDVIGTTWGLGISAIKDNWENTAIPGQMCGISVVTRGGFTGSNPGPSTGAGDTTAYIANVVQADSDNYAAVLEGVSYYMPGGAAAYNGPDQKAIKVQFGAIKDSLDIAIGVVAIALNGALGAAFQAQNTVGGAGPDASWEYFLRYVTDFGAGPYEAFLVNQIGQIVLNNGPAAPVPNSKKTVRVGDSGRLEVLNSVGLGVIAQLSDTGGLNLPPAGTLSFNNVAVIGARRTGWSADTGTAKRTANATYSGMAGATYNQATLQALMNAVRDLSQTQKALKDDFMAHGAIGA